MICFAPTLEELKSLIKLHLYLARPPNSHVKQQYDAASEEILAPASNGVGVGRVR